MVLKPSELTPLSSLVLAQALTEAGLPPGVFNVVTTTEPEGLVTPVITDPRLRKVSFTGSTPVGRHLLRQAADGVLRTSMELGGNAALLVFEDADLDAAIEGAMVAKMRNMGQSCVAANRILVQEGIADEFVSGLAERMTALTVGSGTEPGVDVGPLISDRQRDKVRELVADAEQHGARTVVGHSAVPSSGYFYAPSVLIDVPPAARITREEVFGPVAPIATFRSEADAVRLANDTEFGLVDYVFTRDVARALRMGEALEAGMVGINQGMVSNPAGPFGGVKQSGLGREGGDEGIEEYQSLKYLAVPVPSR